MNKTSLDKNSSSKPEGYFDIFKGIITSWILLVMAFIIQLLLIIKSIQDYRDSINDMAFSDGGVRLIVSFFNNASGISLIAIILASCLGGLTCIFNTRKKNRNISFVELALFSSLIGVVPAGLFYLVYYFMFLPFALPTILQLAFRDASGEYLRQVTRYFAWYSQQPLPMDEFGVILLALVVSVSTIFIGHRLKLKVTHGVTTVTSTN